MTPEAEAFRALVLRHDGVQRGIADELGITVAAVSARLNSELHGSWWKAYKKKRAKRRKAAAARRYRARVAERSRLAYGYYEGE